MSSGQPPRPNRGNGKASKQQRVQASLGDYVEVNERIVEFRERYPDGSLQPANVEVPFEMVKPSGPEGPTFLVYVAAAYRTPDDPRPGIGAAWEPFPGRTPYTKDSELQNAETSAWGRAIIAALAADAKRGIASATEVRNREADRGAPVEASGVPDPDVVPADPVVERRREAFRTVREALESAATDEVREDAAALVVAWHGGESWDAPSSWKDGDVDALDGLVEAVVAATLPF